MLIGRKKHEENGSDDGHYYISISDLMTSLLFIFILILSYVMLSFVKKEDELSNEIKKIEQNIEYRGELLQNFKEELLGKDISVEIDKENGNMRLKSDLLFKSGSADISIEGKRQIGEIAKLFMLKLIDEKYKIAIDTVFIEGHTDSIPIRVSNSCRDLWSNKELSAQRAINTYSEMQVATDHEINNLKNIKNKHLLSYSGYADNRQLCNEMQIEKNATVEEFDMCKSKNRRIEFYFTVNTPDTKKMKEKISD
ncbi:OmpA family protein [Sulfurimonas sp.]|uniref:OmpA/MotB family protein n=1 Tax=Sulfurimonas sp. TaxID=2022749 RepID=UPI002628E519|nr:OmpA family protein [Sulfurimonas sp.]MDD3854886.1 OmpA family protein [Sulfurimonas sp.]